MGKDRNASSGLDGFKAGAFSAMTEIHSHAGRIHACDQAAAKGGQASIARFMTAIAGSIGLVVGQSAAPDPGGAGGLDLLKLVEQRRNGLKMQRHPHPPPPPRPPPPTS